MPKLTARQQQRIDAIAQLVKDGHSECVESGDIRFLLKVINQLKAALDELLET